MGVQELERHMKSVAIRFNSRPRTKVTPRPHVPGFRSNAFARVRKKMSVTTQATFETGHTDQIHDCQYDYYGRVRAIRARRVERNRTRDRS